jgi:hypothetical protein
VLPLASGVTWKLAVSEAIWPDLKSLATTWIWYVPSIVVGLHANGLGLQIPALSVPTL